MNVSEYLAFIPLLFYGISLAELLSQWRRFFDRDYLYWPYFLTTLVFTETAIWNVYLYLDVAGDLTDVTYYKYWLYLTQPMLFLLIVHALTPEGDNKDTEAYFKQRIPIIFGLMAIFIAWHLIPGFSGPADLKYTRIISVVLCFVVAFTRKISIIYIMGIFWLVSLFFREG